MTVGLLSLKGPTAPAHVLPWGYNRRTFFDDFDSLSTVDVNDTRAAGFNWYPHSNWPNAAGIGGAEVGWKAGAAAPANSFSVSNSVLTMSANNSLVNGVLNTAVYNASSGYIGTVFTGGAYFEWRIKFTTPPGGGYIGDSAWPGVWGIAVEFLAGTADKFAEFDVLDGYPFSGGLQALHDWDNSQNPYAHSEVHEVYSPDTAFHKYGMLWVPMSRNGGTGRVRFYIDDVLQTLPNVSYTSGQTYSIFDSHHFPLLMSCGNSGFNMDVDYAAVWQA